MTAAPFLPLRTALDAPGVTPGPWEVRDTEAYAEIIAPGARQPVALVARREDADFIAASRSLLSAHDALLAENARLRADADAGRRMRAEAERIYAALSGTFGHPPADDHTLDGTLAAAKAILTAGEPHVD